MFQIEEWVNGERSLTPYFANNAETKDYPIITLINGNSASASEVFAAGMIEAGGFDVVGTPSFGKGTMQVPKSLRTTNGDELQASSGRWLTPEGNWINKNGGDFESVIPTVVVEQNPVFSAFSIFLSDGEVLGFDQVSPQIQNAQIILTALGYELRQDGYFDQNTEDQLKIYQTNNALPVTGEIDALTAAKLSEALFNYRRDLDQDFQLQTAIRMLIE
jgi:carboxyl-terminal processing protease